MRLVISTDCFLPRWDGVARFIKEFLPYVKDWKVTIFAPDFDGDVHLPSNVSVLRFPLVKYRFGDIYFSNPDKKVMASAIKNADVVFNQTIGPIGGFAIKLAKKFKKPVVSYVHSIEWTLVALAIRRFRAMAGWIVRRRAKSLYNKCSLLLVPSHEVEDLLTGNKIKALKKVIHLGVDIDSFVPTHSKAVAKRKVNLSPDSLVVGFCGRIAREKDLPTLVDAFKKVHKKIDNSVLLVVGAGLEHEIPASKTIVRAGAQDDVIPFLQAMDVFVLPSLTETSSLATMEAMACGVPPIVTPVGNLREYIEDGVNGYFFPRSDAEKLAKRLTELLANENLRNKMGSAARKTIVDNYSWQKAAGKIRQALLTAAKFG
ncbi:glycosyltransferase family 4 protein [Candidatus Woesearchaeota archaeon]|nr:glycosyltransferase family 4 protein [Candidatus Woesearchaeota archaeon]